MARSKKSRRDNGVFGSDVESLESRTLLSTTYYVSPSGHDSAAGISDATAFATLQHAADLVGAGDTVVIRAGTYSSGFAMGYSGTGTSGTAAAPISFLADPGVLITGKAPHASSSFLSCIDLSNGCNYVTLSGFTLNDAQGNLSGAGIWVTNCSHVKILNNTATSTAKWGILTGFADYVDIEHNTLSGMGQHGIYIGNACTSPVILYNTSFNNGRSGIQLNGDKQENPGTTGIIDHAIIEYNVCYNDALTSSSAAISLDGTQNSVIGDNLLYDNHGNGIVLFPADGGVLNGGVDPASTNNLIVDNTIANTKYWSIQLIYGSTGNVVLDNVIWSDSSFGSYGSIECDIPSLSGFHSDYNVVVSTNPANGAFNTDANDGTPLSFAQWQAQTGQDAHSIGLSSGSALFATYSSPTASGNDYHLKAGSPAVDSGAGSLAGQNALPQDLDGNPRPQGSGYDIGAYEFPQATSAPAAPTNLAATASGAGQINLSWKDNSNNEKAFLVERSTDGVNFAQVASVGANVTTYGDSGLAASTTYFYRVRAANAAGDSAYSNIVSATTAASGSSGVPSAPSGLTAAAANANQVKLRWTEPASDQTGFQIQRATSGGAYVAIGTASTSARSYTDASAVADTSYSYRVVATDAAGASPFSNAVAVTTPWSFWNNSSKPGTPDMSDSGSVELGVQFQSSVSGYINGIRFYKGPTNTGTHVAHLWSSTGQLLASATFASESSSGWQTVYFAQPVAIAANAVYVASYFAPAGHYADTQNYYGSTGMNAGPLHAITGVYQYGATSSFPSQAYLSSNYWVDVLFFS